MFILQQVQVITQDQKKAFNEPIDPRGASEGNLGSARLGQIGADPAVRLASRWAGVTRFGRFGGPIGAVVCSGISVGVDWYDASNAESPTAAFSRPSQLSNGTEASVEERIRRFLRDGGIENSRITEIVNELKALANSDPAALETRMKSLKLDSLGPNFIRDFRAGVTRLTEERDNRTYNRNVNIACTAGGAAAGVGIVAVGCAIGGVALANCWNPIGWGLGLGLAAGGIAYLCLRR